MPKAFNLKQRIFLRLVPLSQGTLLELDGSYRHMSPEEWQEIKRTDDIYIKVDLPVQRIFLKQKDNIFGVLLDLWRSTCQNLAESQFLAKRTNSDLAITIDLDAQAKLQPSPQQPQVVKLEISLDGQQPKRSIQTVHRKADEVTGERLISQTTTEFEYE